MFLNFAINDKKGAYSPFSTIPIWFRVCVYVRKFLISTV